MDTKSYPQFILLGDSLVQFSSHLRDGFSFTACLEEHCERRLQIINHGLSGYNTDDIMKIIEHLIPSPTSAKVSYLLVLLGANDSCLAGGPTGQHVPLQKYKDNIKAILTHPSVKAQSPAILLVTPPPINEVHLKEDPREDYDSPTRRQTHTAKYAEAIREIAAEFDGQQVYLVDLWRSIIDRAAQLNPNASVDLIGTEDAGDDGNMRTLLRDGLHLSSEGYKVFWDTVKPLVGKEWPKEPVDAPSWVFPHWKKLH